MRKRWVSALLAASVAGTLLAGCGSKNAGSSQAPAGSQAAGKQTANEASGTETAGNKTFTMFLRSTFIDWIGELKWYDVAEERTGVKVEYVKGPGNQKDTYAEVDQRLISGTLTDCTFVNQAQANVYGAQGAFLDLAPLIKEHAPNIQKFLDENPDYTSMVTNEDGTLSGLLSVNPKIADLAFYRADHFEKAGIDASAIETVDDFTEALRALKAFYGKDNPNYYPLSGRETYFRFQSWFDCANNISAEESNGLYYSNSWSPKKGYDIYADNFYHMMEVMKLWYDEGLVQPEWVAGAYSEGDWEAAMLNGDCSVGYDFVTRPQWFLDNGGPDIDPNYSIAIFDNFKDENGNVMKGQVDMPYNESRTTVINAAVSDETAQTIIQFIDYFFSEEGMTLANWGVEGESFQVVDGKKEYIVNYADEEGKAAGEKKWSFLSDRYTVCKPIDQEAFYAWNGDVVKEATARLFTEEYLHGSCNLKYTEAQTKELDQIVASLGDQIVADLTAFVTGKTELNEANWQAFLDEMAQKGYTRAEEIQLEAFRATYGE